jgi:hypothetical protein
MLSCRAVSTANTCSELPFRGFGIITPRIPVSMRKIDSLGGGPAQLAYVPSASTLNVSLEEPYFTTTPLRSSRHAR